MNDDYGPSPLERAYRAWCDLDAAEQARQRQARLTMMPPLEEVRRIITEALAGRGSEREKRAKR